MTKEIAINRPEPLLRVPDVERWLGVSERTVYDWISAGVLDPIHLSKRSVRFDPRDIRKLLEERRHSNRAEIAQEAMAA